MRKILFISSFILILISISMLGYKFVSANKQVDRINNIIEEQQVKEKYIAPYGYTIDNPNIILNPYGNSPLTALILFETSTEEEITVKIKEKDNSTKIENTFKSNTKHYIPIYGLYADYENKIEIKCGNTKKIYTIKTEPLPESLTIEKVINNTNEFSFLNTNGYIYALDSNNEVRWYLIGKYKYNIDKISNGNFIIPSSNLNNKEYPIGFMEIDLLGKVYKQYNIEYGYYGSYIEKDSSYLVLSKNLIEIDKQTGTTSNKIELDETYNKLNYNSDTNIISLENEVTNLSIDLKTNEKSFSSSNKIISNKEFISPLYTINNYILTKGISLNTIEETEESTKNIFVINYKKTDDNYKKYNIKIIRESELLKVVGDFNNEEAYVILDKFLDKKIYNITNNSILINLKFLEGKYSIYIKIKDKIYKTNTFIKV